MEQAISSTEQFQPKRSRAGMGLLVAAAVILLTVVALYWNRHSIDGSVQAALADETGAETSVYRRSWIGGNDIVFDVQSVSGEMSMVDMTRRLLKSAEALKDSEFGRVYLAYDGGEKFYLEGTYFKRLGEEREWQNPVYTVRTMPENVFNLDGTPAFGAWTGGWLGVLGEQLDDNNEFHRKWWVDNALVDLDA